MRTIEMRPSNVLQKLRAGGIATCFKMNLADARVAEIVAMTGFDCIWTDVEHVPNDWVVVENIIRTAKAYDVDVLVRVERGSYSGYIRPLEMDAAGIMVPHCMGLDDAKQVVHMTRFHPVGRRPLDGGNADGRYCRVPMADYLKTANEQRLVVLQIEDPEPLAELDAIAALDGVDMLFFGPGDFSQAIGAPGAWDHPDLLAARRKVAATAVKHGKFAGTVGSPDNFDELAGLGYRFINVGADVVGLARYGEALLAAVEKHSVKNYGKG